MHRLGKFFEDSGQHVLVGGLVVTLGLLVLVLLYVFNNLLFYLVIFSLLIAGFIRGAMRISYLTRKPYIAILLCVGITLIYVWLTTAGTMTQWRWTPNYTTDYYDALGKAFLKGQTFLLIPPRPELLALSDPYDPALNAQYRLHDASLYQGKYYLYWGPAPGFIVAGIDWFSVSGVIDDSFLVFGFLFGVLIFSALLLLSLKRRFFPDLPQWVVIPGILLVGLSSPVPWLLARPAIYEAAIAGGQFFLVCGLYCAISGLGEPRPKLWRLSGAGISWALAAGTRVNLVPAILFLAVCIVWLLYQQSSKAGWSRVYTTGAIGLIAPVLLSGVLLGLYNYVRFGSILEFGTSYQLAGINMRLLSQRHENFSLAAFWYDLYSYFFHPPDLSPVFPYLVALPGSTSSGFPTALNLPGVHSVNDQVNGLVWTLPFALFVVIPFISPASLMRDLAPLFRGFPGISGTGDGLFKTFMPMLLGGAALLEFLPLLLVPASTMRYLEDYIPTLVVLSVWGFWMALQTNVAHPKRRGAIELIGIILVAISVVVGLLLGVTGEFNHFQTHNPLLIAQIRAILGSATGH